MASIDNYPGAKTNSGIIQFLINRIPYHTRYFEMFAGSAQLFKHKKPAAIRNVLTDINDDTVKQLQKRYGKKADVYRFAAMDYINSNKVKFTRADLLYWDPPYPFVSRRSGKRYYKYEMSDDDHVQLLSTGLQMDTNIMISTRQNDLYDEMLKDWRKESVQVMGSMGVVDEIVYMNYPPPTFLHQYDMWGGDCWKRQGVKRKIERFENKIGELPVYEQHLFIQQMIKHNRNAVAHFLDNS